MAKPIKETPILFGRDAQIFASKIEYNEKHPAPREEYDGIMAIYQKIKNKIK